MSGILEKISKVGFLRSEDGVLGIDIGSSAIKIVQIQKEGGKVVLKNYGSLSLGPYAGKGVGQAVNVSEDVLATALTDLIRESGVTTKTAAMAVPLKDTMISFVKMPNLGKKQLEKMIPIEARRHIPVPLSEVVLDFWIMPGGDDVKQSVPGAGSRRKGREDDKVDVMLAAIHNSSLRTLQNIKDAAALDVDLFEVELFSTIRAVTGHEEGPIMIVDIGAATTKLAMVEYGILRGSHIVSKGSQDVTMVISKSLGVDMEQAEKIKRDPKLITDQVMLQRFTEVAGLPFAHIFAEANNMLTAYQTKKNKTVKKIILSGGGATLAGLHKLAGESFNVAVEVSNPFSRLETPAFLEDTLTRIGPEFSVAIGLALEIL